MHVNYIIFGLIFLFEKANFGKKSTYILVSFILIIFLFITGFTPSVTRACVMGIMMLFSKILFRKNDLLTSISFSLILILINNPFSIYDVGLQLSYAGTLRNNTNL